ncbi:hypothetical protein INR49_015580 [Caranx melampygus]|nr:hypothetical protein INR49_015580 [Caranx melampygus]
MLVTQATRLNNSEYDLKLWLQAPMPVPIKALSPGAGRLGCWSTTPSHLDTASHTSPTTQASPPPPPLPPPPPHPPRPEPLTW